jgi:hypothetical protein
MWLYIISFYCDGDNKWTTGSKHTEFWMWTDHNIPKKSVQNNASKHENDVKCKVMYEKFNIV